MGKGSARGSSSSSSPRGRGEEEEEKKTPFSHFLGHIVNTWGVMLVEHVLFGLTYASDVEECTAGIRLVPEIGRTGHRLRRRTRIPSRGHTLPPGFFLRLVFFLKGVFVLLLHLCPSTHSLVLIMMETDHPRLSPLRLVRRAREVDTYTPSTPFSPSRWKWEERMESGEGGRVAIGFWVQSGR